MRFVAIVEQLIQEGASIRILTEADFITLLEIAI